MFDTKMGHRITENITELRQGWNITNVIGCVPKNYYNTRAPYPSSDSLFSLLTDEVFKTVVKNDTLNKNRIVLLNTGGVRFDLLKGNMTFDDQKIVSPFTNAFSYVPDVPWSDASQVLNAFNTGKFGYKRRVVKRSFEPYTSVYPDLRERASSYKSGNCEMDFDNFRLQNYLEEAYENYADLFYNGSYADPLGYVTKDDYGDDGDDTVHDSYKMYKLPYYIQGTYVDEDILQIDTVDVVHTNFSTPGLIDILNQYGTIGRKYTEDEVQYYLVDPFVELTNIFELYAQKASNWSVPARGHC
jgi:hypothetical protein